MAPVRKLDSSHFRNMDLAACRAIFAGLTFHPYHPVSDTLKLLFAFERRYAVRWEAITAIHDGQWDDQR